MKNTNPLFFSPIRLSPSAVNSGPNCSRPKPRGWKSWRGFTLIELLVSLSLLSIVIVTATSFFLFSIKSEKKAETYIRLKQNGDHALNMMRTKIRNADGIVSCPGDSIRIKNPPDFGGGETTFSKPDKQILVDGADLTSDEFEASGLSFSCSPADPPIVSLSFTLREPNTGEEQAFRTTVSLRNY